MKQYILALSLVLFGFVACTESIPEREPSPVPTEGSQVFIYDNTPTNLKFIPSDPQQFVIKMGRAKEVASSAATIKLVVDDPDGVFTVPSSVSFAAGVTEADVLVKFDLQLGQKSTLTVGFADDNIYAYGSPKRTISVLRDYVWIDMGKVEYNEEDFGFGTALVPIQRAEGTNIYRLPDLYNYYDETIPKGLNLTFTLDDNYNAVSLPDGFTNLGTGYEIYWNTIKYGAYCTFTNVGSKYKLGYIITPDRSKLYVGSASFVWVEGFPGVEAKDYSMALSYLGHFIDPEGKADNAIVKFTSGVDVASYKYAVVNGALTASTAEGVANQIIDGTLASEEDTQGGYKLFPFTDAGKYSVIAVSYNAAGEAQEFGYVSFDFTPAGMESPWVSLGFCSYTDDLFIPMYSNDPLADIPTYDVEILEHKDTPGLFRLKNAYGAGYPYNEPGDYTESDVYIEINATDPNGVYIDYQPMGVDWGDGAAYIYSYASYYMDNGYTLEQAKAKGYCGAYANNVITFPVKRLLITFEGSSSLYYGNINGLWKVDMTSLRSSISKSAHLRSSISRSFNPKATSLTMKSIVPVKVKGKNVPAAVIINNRVAIK